MAKSTLDCLRHFRAPGTERVMLLLFLKPSEFVHWVAVDSHLCQQVRREAEARLAARRMASAVVAGSGEGERQGERDVHT